MPENPNRHTVCGAKGRTTGEPCQKRAGWGTDHLGYGYCKFHGGSTTAHKTHAMRLEAADLPMVMGLPADTEPNDAVMRAISIANGRVNWCTQWIAKLSTPHELVQVEPSADLQRWLSARDNAADTLVRYAKIAHDMGISERQVAIAEGIGDMLADLVGGVLGELGLTVDQQERAPLVVQRHLELVASRVA